MAILGATLIAFGIGVIFINQGRVAQGIDRDLRDRAMGSIRPRGGPGGPGGPGGAPFGLGGGPGPGGPGERGEPGMGARIQGGIGGGIEPPIIRGQGFPQSPPPGMDPDVYKIANLRRPRHFDTNLQPLSEGPDRPLDAKAARLVLQSGNAVYTDGVFEGERVRIFTMPWRQEGQTYAVAQVAHETRELDRLWRTQSLTLAIFLPCALILAGLGGIFLAGRAMKPIGQMQEKANRIGGSNLSDRLDIHGEDEFADLGRTFNAMIGRLEQSFDDLSAALENQKRFTADASHELRTPLTRLKLATSSALQPTATAEEKKRALELADQAADSMGRLVQQLLLLAKADAGQLALQRERVDLRIVCSEAVEMVSRPSAVELETHFPERAIYLQGDADALKRLVTNLLENAYRHTPKGKVEICLDETDSQTVLRIADTGVGIEPEHLPRLTERFYRVDTSRTGETGGSGLGLAICQTIVEEHGGELLINSVPGKGTTVTASFSRKSVTSPNQTSSS